MIALGANVLLYRDAPEADAACASGSLVIREFLEEALPSADGPAYSDEAGHRFRFEAGQSFRFHSGRRSDLKAAICRTDPGSVGCLDRVLFQVKRAVFQALSTSAVFACFHR